MGEILQEAHKEQVRAYCERREQSLQILLSKDLKKEFINALE